MPQVAISSKLTLTLTSEQWQPVESAVFAGRKVEAIKLVREIMPAAGLAEAKHYVEKIESDLREKQPEQFSASRDSSPMMRGLLALLVVIAITGFLVFKLLHK